jgi:tetratricopeptide (TPR) repeat protein
VSGPTADAGAARWTRVKALFGEAVALGPGERARHLRAACGDDAALRDEVESLLAAHDGDPEYLEAGIGALVPLGDAEAEPSLAGRRLGPYRLVRQIGRGGMGAVYLAERDDDEFRQRVAVKVVRDVSRAQLQRRFRRERQILAGLEHPSIARLLDGGTSDDGIPYVVMEYVDGEPIDRYCTRRGLGLRERLALFRTVCGAVQYAHQRLVVHRDIKPANILVTADGAVKLLDFGIATLMHSVDAAATPRDGSPTTLHALTPEYASPEQIANGAVTTLSDVYSLGVLLYVLTTDRHPFREDASLALAVARLVMESEPPRPSEHAVAWRRELRGDIDTIVLTAMRRDPARRYASAERLSDDVRRHLGGLPLSARPDTLGYRATTFVRRHRAAVAASTLAVLAFAGAGASALWQARTARAERARAERRVDEVRELATTFLVELHDSIAPLPGSTPVRALLVRRAVATLDGLSAEARDDASLQRDLAAAYLRVGDVQGLPYSANLGDTEGALASYQKARAILGPLARANAGDRAAHRDLVVAHQRLCVVWTRDGRVSDAIASGRAALALAEALVSTAPASASLDSARALAATSHMLLARAIYQQHAVPTVREALAHLDSALAIRERLAAAAPQDEARKYAVAVAHANTAYAYLKLADLTGDAGMSRVAVAELREAQVVQDAIVAARPTALSRRRAADGRREIALVALALGDVRAAIDDNRAAVATFDSLAGADPANVEARRDLAVAHQQLGAALATAGDSAGAVAHHHRARQLLEAVLAVDARSAEDRMYLARSVTALHALRPRPPRR